MCSVQSNRVQHCCLLPGGWPNKCNMFQGTVSCQQANFPTSQLYTLILSLFWWVVQKIKPDTIPLEDAFCPLSWWIDIYWLYDWKANQNYTTIARRPEVCVLRGIIHYMPLLCWCVSLLCKQEAKRKYSFKECYFLKNRMKISSYM